MDFASVKLFNLLGEITNLANIWSSKRVISSFFFFLSTSLVLHQKKKKNFSSWGGGVEGFGDEFLLDPSER